MLPSTNTAVSFPWSVITGALLLRICTFTVRLTESVDELSEAEMRICLSPGSSSMSDVKYEYVSVDRAD